MPNLSRTFRRSVLLGSALVFVAALQVASGQSQESAQMKQLRETGSCAGCDLTNAQIIHLDLKGADLTGANLAGAFIYRTNLRRATLTGANFQGANLSHSDLTAARDANLAGAQTNTETKCPDGKAGPCAG